VFAGVRSEASAFIDVNIFKKVLVTMFEIASTDRVAGKTNISSSFSFTSTVQGALAPNSSITLTFPVGFFSSLTNISVSLHGKKRMRNRLRIAPD
jgi:hypothetical protein